MSRAPPPPPPPPQMVRIKKKKRIRRCKECQPKAEWNRQECLSYKGGFAFHAFLRFLTLFVLAVRIGENFLLLGLYAVTVPRPM